MAREQGQTQEDAPGHEHTEGPFSGNCWAKFSTASPKKLVWDMGELRNLTLSVSLMSAIHSQRWRSWTTIVNITQPTDCAVTLVARSARSVAARSSLRTCGS